MGTEMVVRSPLDGIRVLEVGNYMAGPFCGMQLADLGAEVIKIEQPDGGDQVRLTGPFVDGESSPFVRLNRNKRSVVLDLKASEGKEIFKRLAQTADVVIENLRPGTMKDLGLDYQGVLRGLNPRLVYVAASGWGQDGPLSPLAGLDIMAQARSGLMSITGEPGGDPVKVGVPMCDLVCALYGALAAVSALRVRDETGDGQFIDVSLLEAGVSFAVWEAGRYWATGEIPQPLGSAHQNNAPYQAVRAADGYFTIGATSRRNWEAFCEALGLDELLRDERFTDTNTRHQHREVLIPLIEKVTQTAPKQHWIELLERAGVPCAPIQNYEQVFNDEHLLARRYFWDGPHPTLGSVRQLGSPMRFSKTPTRREKAGPLFGEDTEAILRELGYSEADVDRLVEESVVKGPAQWAKR
jgi:crotonobetainyl-CoA:carnitine CoA-transferase CaiB-like acyl-CoA transferase